MGNRYQQLVGIIDEIKPQSIVEIGTNSGTRADMMIRAAQKHHPEVRYVGFDLFEDATPETNAAEMNAKPPAHFEAVWAKLMRPGVSLSLIRGNSRETLHGRVKIADLAFIDGGHSIETIRGDLEALRMCKVIVLDDYYTSGVDTSQFGCNEVVSKMVHTVMPVEDTFGKVGIKMVRIDAWVDPDDALPWTDEQIERAVRTRAEGGSVGEIVASAMFSREPSQLAKRVLARGRGRRTGK